jgi:two-component system, OmpR family, sensor histidine kinase BaeS
VTNRLWFKLTSAFALVIAVGILVTVVVARQGAATRFAHFMVDAHMVRPVQLQEALATYYREESNWAALDAHLLDVVEVASDGVMSDMMGSMMGMHENRIQILDATGLVVADTHGPAGGQPLPAHPVTHTVQRWPIVTNERPVGELLVEGALMVGTSLRNDSLMGGVTRAVLVAGLTAGVVGLLLAMLLVRQITRPLSSLNRASSRIAGGDLSVRVPVQGKDEVGELAVTFNQMADSLETQEQLRRNLMADIAHELRTPLTGIQGTVEALQDGIFPVTPENLEAVHEQVMLLNRLVEDLRTLANAEAGQLVLDRQPLNLVDLCQRQVMAFQSRADAAQIDLTLQLDNGPVTVWGDEQRLGQVLNNLLDNALRHTPPGGSVQVQLAVPNGAVHLAVVDNGEGIDVATLPLLFDRFYRADPSRTRGSGGTGLGLAITRQLVQAHGGRIWAESPPIGQAGGSVFRIELPLCH